MLVYIGAISVLILFAIMLTQSKSGPARLVFHRQWWAGGLAAIGLVLLMLVAVMLTAWPQAGNDIVPQEARQIALLLFDENLFAFEVIGVLLLAAVIGGVFLARREPAARASSGATARRERGRRRRPREPLARRLPRPVGAPLRHRHLRLPLERNAIAMLMSIEIMLNAVNLAIVAFGAFTPALAAQASTIALFVMAVAAAEATVGLAIVIAIYRNRRTPLVDEYASMRE